MPSYDTDGFDPPAPVADVTLVLDQNLGILGRDVLNHAALLLDGPHRQWSEHAPHDH